MPLRQTLPSRSDFGPAIKIRKLTSDELDAAVAILASGMRDNPIHVQAFGTDPDRRQRRLRSFLSPLLGYVYRHGDVLGAYRYGEMVGVLGMIAPGRCRPSLTTALRVAGGISVGNSLIGTLRIGRWLANWRHNDPVEPHWHLGPLVVHPSYRRQGIARRLMLECCRRLDRSAGVGYLETDLAVNATFYATLGFRTIQRDLVLGVPNWFMIRYSRCHDVADQSTISRAHPVDMDPKSLGR